MKYWPLHMVMNSPLLPTAYALELQNFYQRAPSQGAYHAAIDAARQTQAVDAPNLVIIETIDAPAVPIYTKYPGSAEWLRLERTTIMENNEYAFFYMAILH